MADIEIISDWLKKADEDFQFAVVNLREQFIGGVWRKSSSRNNLKTAGITREEYFVLLEKD